LGLPLEKTGSLFKLCNRISNLRADVRRAVFSALCGLVPFSISKALTTVTAVTKQERLTVQSVQTEQLAAGAARKTQGGGVGAGAGGATEKRKNDGMHSASTDGKRRACGDVAHVETRKVEVASVERREEAHVETRNNEPTLPATTAKRWRRIHIYMYTWWSRIHIYMYIYTCVYIPMYIRMYIYIAAPSKRGETGRQDQHLPPPLWTWRRRALSQKPKNPVDVTKLVRKGT
jgi:hypothetical protein